MRGLNRIEVLGNVGADPEVESTPKGTRRAKVSLATNRTYRDGDGRKQEQTEWHRLTLWGKLADIAERYIFTGTRLYAAGRIHYFQWEPEPGQTRTGVEIVVSDILLLDGPRGDGGGRE